MAPVLQQKAGNQTENIQYSFSTTGWHPLKETAGGLTNKKQPPHNQNAPVSNLLRIDRNING